jgi:predicted Zn-ribbon and HTH transcriptional regulator
MDETQTLKEQMSDMQVSPPVKKINPLAAYFRQPKIFLSLPSKGEYYPADALDKSEDNQYPVFAMTAKDELMYKTPDALISGRATVEVIKSCIPAIMDPWAMPSLDVDACLVAIRIATYGDKMGITSSCPSCSHVNDFDLDLVKHLNKLSSFEYEPDIEIGELVVHLRPYNYREISKMSFKASEQEKIFNVINNDKLSDEEKLEHFGASFVKLTELTIDIVTGCVRSISTPDETVTDPKMIAEFINNAPKEVFSAIEQRVNHIAQMLEFRISDAKCSECGHVFDVKVTLDQSNFFKVRS